MRRAVRVALRAARWMRAEARVLVADHLSVLDGRTLNVCVTLPEGAGGARLLACGQALPLELARRGGGLRASGTFPVHPLEAGVRRRARGLCVPEGAGHALGVEVIADGGRWAAYALTAGAAATGGGMAEGPTRAEPPRPDGWQITVGASPAGRAGSAQAALACAKLPPSAEVQYVDAGWRELTLRGRLVGLAPRGATAELALRGAPRTGWPGTAHTLRTTWHGPVFTVVCGAQQLAALAADEEQTWDVRLRVPGVDRPLRMGRLLTDLAAPKTVHRLPKRLLLDGGGTGVRVAPYFTPTGRLAVVTARVRGERV